MTGQLPDTQDQTDHNDNQPADLNLLPPVNYLTTPVNNALLALLMLVARYPWVSLVVAGMVYVSALLMIGIPAFGISREQSFLIVVSPLLLPVVFILTYMGAGSVLLALFARNPGTRLSFAVLLWILVLGPLLIMILSDTLLMLILGSMASFVLIVANLVLTPWLAFTYQERLLRHAGFCLPVLILLGALTWFEQGQAFSYTRIDRQHFSLQDCRWVTPRNKHGAVMGPPYQSCTVHLDYQGSNWALKEMALPDTPLQYLEIRQALFRHYQLR